MVRRESTAAWRDSRCIGFPLLMGCSEPVPGWMPPGLGPRLDSLLRMDDAIDENEDHGDQEGAIRICMEGQHD